MSRIYRAENDKGQTLRDGLLAEYDAGELIADFPDAGPITVKLLSNTDHPVTTCYAILRPLS